MRVRNSLWLWMLVAMAMCSCHRKQPADVLSESKMQSVLYEYHLSKAMASQKDSVEYYKRYYFLGMLKRNHLTEEEFGRSLLWYSQHTDMLYKIYDNINKKLNRESMALGVVTSNMHYYSSLTSTGDTANIWNGRSFYVLSPVGLNNRLTFKIEADSTSQPRDTYLLHFVSKFVYAEGQRDAVVNLAVTYEDDSVQSVTMRVYGDGEYKCELKTTAQKLKYVQGFVYLKSEYVAKPKLLFIRQPALVRFHDKAPVEDTEKIKTDLAVDSVEVMSMDSLPEVPVMDMSPAMRKKPIPFRKRR